MKHETVGYRDIAGVIDRAAAQYDRVGPAIFSYFGNLLVEMAGIHRDTKVLDAGAGRGAILFPAARKVGNNGYVVGIDISREMVRETNIQIDRDGLKNAHMLRMDAQHLSFKHGSFDYVLSGFSIFFCPGPLKALSEFKRVLVKKGIVGITSRALDRETQWLGQLIERFVPMNTSGCKNNDDKNLFPGLHTPAGIEYAMRTVGFANIEIIEKQGSFAYQNEEEWWAAQWANGSRRHLETMNPELLERFKTEAYKELRYYKKKKIIYMPFRIIAALGANAGITAEPRRTRDADTRNYHDIRPRSRKKPSLAKLQKNRGRKI